MAAKKIGQNGSGNLKLERQWFLVGWDECESGHVVDEKFVVVAELTVNYGERRREHPSTAQTILTIDQMDYFWSS